MKNEPYVIERVYNAPIAKVWKAITNHEDMKHWYFNIPAFKPEVGFEFTFTGDTPDEKRYVHLCRIMEVIPEKKLSYTWKYEDYEGDSLVTFELYEEENGTRLKLTHEGLETFPAGDPNFARESFNAGWTHIIGHSLKAFAEQG